MPPGKCCIAICHEPKKVSEQKSNDDLHFHQRIYFVLVIKMAAGTLISYLLFDLCNLERTNCLASHLQMEPFLWVDCLIICEHRV